MTLNVKELLCSLSKVLPRMTDGQIDFVKEGLSIEKNRRNALKRQELYAFRERKSIYRADCHNANGHHDKSVHWAKLLKGININEEYDDSVIGIFLDIHEEHQIIERSFVVERCGDELKAYQILLDKKYLLIEGTTSDYNTFLNAVDKRFHTAFNG
ncbi:hypothetical protein [Sporosarcina sp. YIM B06819]|uniref:hypothetical protein n=1 Tax=Sporosarcina sp. YIM B06819 TaxID=3081769 RepID=UPI00298C0D1B|nr:hypothetical protein [Sporosarcina sp. YIM B06819]